MITIILFIVSKIPVILSLSVGEEIDIYERSYYRIFPDISNFREARVFKIGKNKYKVLILTVSDSLILYKDSIEIVQFREYIDYYEELKRDPNLRKKFEEKWKNLGYPLKSAFFLGNIKRKGYKIEKKVEGKVTERAMEKSVTYKKGSLLFPSDPLSKIISFDEKGIPITQFEVNAVRGVIGRVSCTFAGIFTGFVVSLTLLQTLEGKSFNPIYHLIIPVTGFGFASFFIGSAIDREMGLTKIKKLRKRNIFLPPSLFVYVSYDTYKRPILKAEVEARKGFGWRGIIGIPCVAVSFPFFFIAGAGVYMLADYMDTKDAIWKAKKKFRNIRDENGIPIYLKNIYNLIKSSEKESLNQNQ